MEAEDRKFLDLDHVCDEIANSADRAMFSEAIRCYQIGSHRAAVILAWSVTTECLSRRIEELATENDGAAQKSRSLLTHHIGKATYEETLITQAYDCSLIDEYEGKCLRFSRDIRSKCAHPTGVIPSAEAVRNIFHICSQTVLCREGYRGLSFVKSFIETSLSDTHIFSVDSKQSEICRYYMKKVPERLYPQFGDHAARHMRNCTTSAQWKSNTLVFFRHLLFDSDTSITTMISRKLNNISAVDQIFLAQLIGTDTRGNAWDAMERSHAKITLRTLLKTGSTDENVFLSYATICAIDGLDANDLEVCKERLHFAAKRFAKHSLFVENQANEFLSILRTSLESQIDRNRGFGVLAEISSTPIFHSSPEDTDAIIDHLIASNWQEDGVAAFLGECNNWHTPLMISFLVKSEAYFLECSEDIPEDIFVPFEVVTALLRSAPNYLPREFEQTLSAIVNNDISISWARERGECYRAFLGQVNVLKTQYSVHFGKISDIEFSEMEPDSSGLESREV